nr:MFS transporter [Cypionkella psychrotolerans]
MFAQNLADRLAAKGVHYAWVVAGVTFLTMLATAGAMGSAGVLIGPLQAEFGWTKAEISSALAVRMMLFGLLGPFAAAMMNSFGLRSIVALALGLIVTGIAGSFFMTSLWQLVLLWGVIIGTGTGMTALVLGATVATRWFSTRRGLVMGMMTASNATGQLVFLPMFALVTGPMDGGWRCRSFWGCWRWPLAWSPCCCAITRLIWAYLPMAIAKSPAPPSPIAACCRC